jgi:hypothetical protein
MVFGVAVSKRNGLLVALRDVAAPERKTRRVERVKVLLNDFLLTHGEGDLAKEQVTAISIHLIAGAAEFEAVQHVGGGFSRSPLPVSGYERTGCANAHPTW